MTQEVYGRREIARCVDNWGDGQIFNLIASFAKTEGVSVQEREMIRGILDGMD